MHVREAKTVWQKRRRREGWWSCAGGAEHRHERMRPRRLPRRPVPRGAGSLEFVGAGFERCAVIDWHLDPGIFL